MVSVTCFQLIYKVNIDGKLCAQILRYERKFAMWREIVECSHDLIEWMWKSIGKLMPWPQTIVSTHRHRHHTALIEMDLLNFSFVRFFMCVCVCVVLPIELIGKKHEDSSGITTNYTYYMNKMRLLCERLEKASKFVVFDMEIYINLMLQMSFYANVMWTHFT